MTKGLLVLFVTTSVLASCDTRHLEECVKPPYTPKERKLIRDLEQDGFEVELDRYHFSRTNNCDLMHSAGYTIKVHQVPLTKVMDNIYVRDKARLIVNELYTQVLEDSVLIKTPEISIRFESKDSTEAYPYGLVHWNRYKIEDLEKYCGFKVKQTGDNEFIRVQVTKSDSLRSYMEGYNK